LLIDSGVDSRVSELSDVIFKATRRPITRLMNTHWHFDHTGGNVFFGSGGVTIIAQENVKKRLSSVQNVPFIGLRDGRYPTQALPTVTYSISMTLRQDGQHLTLVNLRSRAHGWRHNYLHLSGECCRGWGYFLESPLPHHRSSVRRIY